MVLTERIEKEAKARSDIPAVNYAEAPGNQIYTNVNGNSEEPLDFLPNLKKTTVVCKQNAFKYETRAPFLQIR